MKKQGYAQYIGGEHIPLKDAPVMKPSTNELELRKKIHFMLHDVALSWYTPSDGSLVLPSIDKNAGIEKVVELIDKATREAEDRVHRAVCPTCIAVEAGKDGDGS